MRRHTFWFDAGFLGPPRRIRIGRIFVILIRIPNVVIAIISASASMRTFRPITFIITVPIVAATTRGAPTIKSGDASISNARQQRQQRKVTKAQHGFEGNMKETTSGLKRMHYAD